MAAIALFTAIRLYQLQQTATPTAPESQPLAFDCETYHFNVTPDGTVTASNNSSEWSSTPQQARIYINDNLADTFNVISLGYNQSTTLGTVTVPQGEFSWRVEGTVACTDTGYHNLACETLTFTITSQTPTPTTTETPTPTNTPTLTPTPTPTNTPTNTPTGTPNPTATPTNNPTDTPTPTNTPTQSLSSCNETCSTDTDCSGSLVCSSGRCRNNSCTADTDCTCTTAQADSSEQSPELPEAGFTLPTIAAFTLGLLLVFWAVILAV